MDISVFFAPTTVQVTRKSEGVTGQYAFFEFGFDVWPLLLESQEWYFSANDGEVGSFSNFQPVKSQPPPELYSCIEKILSRYPSQIVRVKSSRLLVVQWDLLQLQVESSLLLGTLTTTEGDPALAGDIIAKRFLDRIKDVCALIEECIPAARCSEIQERR